MNTKLKTLPLALLIVAASAFAVTGCGEKTDDAKDSAADTPAVSITEPWARVTTPKQDTGAAYMTLASENGDKLTKVEVPSNIADHAELHEVKMAMDGSDKMQMKQVQSIEIPAGGSVTLKPGSYHVMLMDLKNPIEAGQQIELTLTFAKSGKQSVLAIAKD